MRSIEQMIADYNTKSTFVLKKELNAWLKVNTTAADRIITIGHILDKRVKEQDCDE